MLEAKTQASTILERAQKTANTRSEEIIRQATEEAVAIREKASADIAQEKKKAINDAKDEIAGISLAIAGKVVGRELTADDQKNLIDSFINELGDQV
jgi:F-type H+-transporting ATPase subunit b